MQMISQVLKACVCRSYLAPALEAEPHCRSKSVIVPVVRLGARPCAPPTQVVRATAIRYKAVCLQKAYQITNHDLLRHIHMTHKC